MNTEPNANGPEVDPKALKFLEIMGKLLVPGTFIGLITRFAGVSDKISNISAFSAFVITALVLFLPEYHRRVTIVLLAALSVVLGVALYGEITNHLEIKDDAFMSWQKDVNHKVKSCGQSDDCIVNAITESYPSINSNYASLKLANDLKAGAFFLTQDTIRRTLDKLLGIKEHFLGTGFALADNNTPYHQARVAEFLIPNLPDSDNDVATWTFQPIAQTFEMTIQDVILSTRPHKIKSEINKFRKAVQNNINKNLDNDKPAIVRIAQLTRDRYSGKLGRNEAKRVFGLQLATVWNVKIGELNRLSGYTLKNGSNRDKLLFIWVYLPSHTDEVVPATWRNIIGNLGKWNQNSD